MMIRKMLKIITMQTSTLYVDEADAANPKPLQLTASITPFGLQKLGEQVNTWQFWTAGSERKSKGSSGSSERVVQSMG